MTAEYEWTLAEPRALARFVNERDLVAPLTFPADLSRVDTHTSGGASAVAAEIYQAIAGVGLNLRARRPLTRVPVVQRICKPATLLARTRDLSRPGCSLRGRAPQAGPVELCRAARGSCPGRLLAHAKST